MHCSVNSHCLIPINALTLVRLGMQQLISLCIVSPYNHKPMLSCRAKSKHASSAPKTHHPGSPRPTPHVPQLAVPALARGSSAKGRPGVAPKARMHSPRRRKDVWDEDQSLLNILSQSSPHRYVNVMVTELRIQAKATFGLC